MIEIKNITIMRRQIPVLENFSAQIASGSIVAITGPNGSGKSSLIAALAGDLPLVSGSIKMDGRDLAELSLKEQAKLRSVVAQSRNYWVGYSVQEVVSLGQEKNAPTAEVLELLQMSSLASRNITTLSGGELQRVDLARALVRETSILLLDEPFAAQDLESRARLISVLIRLRTQGKTVLLVAHMDEADLKWCDQTLRIGQ